jgi:alpha-glucosidase (family GH31 glycosyl hydrolase)
MIVIKESVKQISPSSFHFLIKQNDMIHSCKIISYKHGFFRILFDNQAETKYKNKTNIGENLEVKTFTNFIKEENRIIVETIEDEEIKLNLDIDISNLCHEYTHKKTQTYKLEIILYPNFMINYYSNDILVSSINKNKKLAVLSEKNFNPNSIDFTSYNTSSVHGLPERLSSFSLKDDAYRLYNLDVFEQVIGSPKSLYGSIPMLHHVIGSGDSIFTIFVNNCSETWVELETLSEKEKKSTWSTEGGVLDIYLFSDSNFHKIFYKIATLTGFTPMAPIFSLGYHHCRWGFLSQDDIIEVDELMTKNEIPYDVLWLDIDVKYDILNIISYQYHSIRIKNITLPGIN